MWRGSSNLLDSITEDAEPILSDFEQYYIGCLRQKGQRRQPMLSRGLGMSVSGRSNTNPTNNGHAATKGVIVASPSQVTCSCHQAHGVEVYLSSPGSGAPSSSVNNWWQVTKLLQERSTSDATGGCEPCWALLRRESLLIPSGELPIT